MVKALINDYFNDKPLLLMLLKLQSNRPKRQSPSLFLVKRKTHDQTQVIIEQETKNDNKFFRSKTWLCFI
ncbi:hypothetical protein [Spiroplasma poulsonii]|uniref:hypothetical protein n=1 Tax=Spiroplasma poulsonii TaxID=2138 RepID=UPI001F4C78DA|nr:hypothetical protein [Spiroplasma poulsonii]UNF61343.1 hypothetical protein MNU24_05355 [Spiroplasma poulsonii]